MINTIAFLIIFVNGEKLPLSFRKIEDACREYMKPHPEAVRVVGIQVRDGMKVRLVGVVCEED